jgi:hypothetical protein
MKSWTILVVLMIVVTAWGQAGDQPGTDAAGKAITRPSANIALSASYTLDPAPNYVPCTDPGDSKQLTDGIYSEGYFWVQRSTVGWQNCRPVVITLDLGAVKPIRGVSYHTAAGTAGVAWPSAILVFVGDAANELHEAGDLLALSASRGWPPAEGYRPCRFWTDTLRTHGRYVALAVWGQPYVFVDEIEVFEGDPSWVNEPLQGEPVADVKAYTGAVAVHSGIVRRLQRDIEAVREKAKRPEIPQEVRNAVSAELDAATRAMFELPTHPEKDFRAILPLNAPHERVFRAQARLWQAQGCAPLTIWQSGLWEPLSPTADPPREAKALVRIDLMLNEFRAGAFNVTNAAPQDQPLELRILGLPGDANPPYITVHEVAWTDTNAGIPVAAALPEAANQGGAYLVHAPSGLTRQVWLTAHPGDIAPGEYHGTIELNAGPATLNVPITLKLYPMRFPEKPRLHFGGWDYTNVPNQYQVTPENRSAFVAHLRAHFVDSPWGTAGALPFGKHDDAGNMTAEPDTANFDAWIDLWLGATQYCVFVSVGDHLGKAAMGTPEFARAVNAWITFWADHARKKNVKPEQLALLLVDEPQAPEQDAVILAWAKAIRAAGAGVRVWEDTVHKDMAKANQDMVAACHVLCPNRQIFLFAPQDYRDYFVGQRERGATLEFYSCSGPARLLDPYAYHRLQAWTCWQYGATASYFWAFGDDGGGTSWNEYAQKGSAYTPLFLDAASVTAGKHLEACRESIEDYECLAMLRDAIADADASGRRSDALDRARTVLASVPGEVCDRGKSLTFRWSAENVDRAAADRARIEILEALAALQEKK